MERKKQNCCRDCEYFRVLPEYWHDHYLIPEHYFCVRDDKLNGKEINPNDCCERFEKEK